MLLHRVREKKLSGLELAQGARAGAYELMDHGQVALGI